MPERSISHYRILSKLGAGGMGEVYLAEDTRLGRRVAVKLLSPEAAGDERARRRLVREARLAATLDHPNICVVHEVGEEAGRSFIVMQYVEGETLDAVMRRRALAPAEALRVAAQAADALAEAHARGVVHRDLKPQNVMLTPRGDVKVMDFGLAKATGDGSASPAGADEARTLSLLTAAGAIIGTPAYMSPEQLRGRPLDARADIFSLGVVLYEMIAGRHPFLRETVATTVSAIITEEPQPLARFAPGAPAELERVVRKCLAKDRERRYQPARDLHTDLEAAARELSDGSTAGEAKTRVLAPPATAAQGRRLTWRARLNPRRAPLVAAAAVVALGLVAALAYVLRARRASSDAPAVKSLAVLPLKSLDAGENYLGLGIADAVIRRISQTGGLTVRPLSAVRHYLNEDTDALTAARQLDADAVLEGSVQRSDERLRVSVNLLRASDGASLWADQFDMRAADIFTIQDKVSEQVASSLRLRLDPAQQARLTKHSTTNPAAYEFYVKGVYSFDRQLGSRAGTKMEMQPTTDLFKKAVEADPDYALAHAQLANVYAYTALFVEPTEPAWAERAREEIERAQSLDPQLAETRVARSELLWSGFGGWQIEAAIRELRDAQQLNPNVGHDGLGSLYQHAGLEDLSARELQRALEIDPTSEGVKRDIVSMFAIVRKEDEAFAAAQKFFGESRPDATYLMSKGRLDEAQKVIEEQSAKEPDNLFLPQRRALLFALKGDFRAAESEIPSILNRHPVKGPTYHHATYDIACVYALEGKSEEAVKWLRETASTGFPCYPLFARDAYLNRVRQSPGFIKLMEEMKAQNEKFRAEFGG